MYILLFLVVAFSFGKMSERINATIVGHSYVARLERGFEEGRFVARGPRGLRYNFIGVGGGRMHPPGCYKSMFRSIGGIKGRRPEIVFLHCGENDIGTPEVDYYDIVESMVNLITHIATECQPEFLLVGQLTKFPAHGIRGALARQITKRLEQWAQNRGNRVGHTRIKIWYHDIKINRTTGARFFCPDDVHLNAKGMRNYYKSVMAAVGRYSRIVLEERRTRS